MGTCLRRGWGTFFMQWIITYMWYSLWFILALSAGKTLWKISLIFKVYMCNKPLLFIMSSVEHQGPLLLTSIYWVITCPVKCGVKLLTHIHTSKVPLKFGNDVMISSHICNGCNYLFMLGLKIKRSPGKKNDKPRLAHSSNCVDYRF